MPATASEKESSDDLEELEKARAALQAQLLAANSEEETSGSEAKKSSSTETETEAETDDHEEAKKKDHYEPPDGSGGSGGSGGPPGSSQDQPRESSGSGQEQSDQSETKEKESEKQPKDDHKDRDRKSDHKMSHKNGHRSDHKSDRKDRDRDRKSDHHHGDHKNGHKSDRKDRDRDRKSDHRNGHKSDHRDHKKDHHRKSDGHKSDSHKKDHKRDHHRNDRKSSDHRSDRDRDPKKSDKSDKKEKIEKSKEKLEKIEAKVKEKSDKSLKSDKFTAFDMFAPKVKTTLPKFAKPLNSPKALPQSPKTFPSPKASSSPSLVTSPKSSGTSSAPPVFAKKSEPKKVTPKKEEFIVHSVKSYPDLPVPQTEGIDKEKQHKDDIAETKRRLQELRQRKEAEMKQKEKKSRRKSTSSSSIKSPKAEPPRVSSDDDIKRYDNKEGDSDSDVEIKNPVKKKKRIPDEESDDDDMENHHGFKPEEANQQSPQIQALSKLLESIPDVPDFQPTLFPIQFSAQGYPGGAAKLVQVLKSYGLGNPELVQVLPQWLEDKLCLWQLSRDKVKIITDSRQIRKRKQRIYTEKEYDEKCGVPVKQAKVALDDIEAQLAMMDQDDHKPDQTGDPQASTSSKKEEQMESDSEEEFRGFPIDPKTQEAIRDDTNAAQFGSIKDMDLYEMLDDDSMPQESHMEVHFSPSLVTHFKKVLAKDKEAIKELNKIERENKIKSKAPQDYPLPPSPESNPSDSSDKGTFKNSSNFCFL